MSTKILTVTALVACLAVVGACQAQYQEASPTTSSADTAVARIMPSLPIEKDFIAFQDDWAVATLRWLRDQDVLFAAALNDRTSDEGRRIITSLRKALREEAKTLIDGHTGAFPDDLTDFVTRE